MAKPTKQTKLINTFTLKWQINSRAHKETSKQCQPFWFSLE